MAGGSFDRAGAMDQGAVEPQRRGEAGADEARHGGGLGEGAHRGLEGAPFMGLEPQALLEAGKGFLETPRTRPIGAVGSEEGAEQEAGEGGGEQEGAEIGDAGFRGEEVAQGVEIALVLAGKTPHRQRPDIGKFERGVEVEVGFGVSLRGEELGERRGEGGTREQRGRASTV